MLYTPFQNRWYVFNIIVTLGPSWRLSLAEILARHSACKMGHRVALLLVSHPATQPPSHPSEYTYCWQSWNRAWHSSAPACFVIILQSMRLALKGVLSDLFCFILDAKHELHYVTMIISLSVFSNYFTYTFNEFSEQYIWERHYRRRIFTSASDHMNHSLRNAINNHSSRSEVSCQNNYSKI